MDLVEQHYAPRGAKDDDDDDDDDDEFFFFFFFFNFYCFYKHNADLLI